MNKLSDRLLCYVGKHRRSSLLETEMKARVHEHEPERVIARCAAHLERVGLSEVPLIGCGGRREGQPEARRSVTNTRGARTEVLSEG